MADQFSRTRLLLGATGVQKLQSAHICVFGLGGVGGYVVEALVRAGVGAVDIVDDDTVCESNLNRQIIATWDTVGMPKVDAMEARIHAINPHCQVVKHRCFYLPETRGQFDFSTYDYIVDAIDTVTAKIDLALAARDAGVPFISCMGTGNKLDPTQLEVADISETSVCKLARVMRRELRKRGVEHLKCVYSKEQPALADPASCLPEDLEELGERRSTPGSVSFVPSAAGLIIAGEVIKDLMRL